ncbi:conserved hypothetical protein [Candidatus Desulfarcum epimagneticum]|uniref:Uncharacterized protein n=1 Tax=uncultured Desulfobacteraceae bacterium TaxID=218296 RepID=A0A484HFV4_9BACT|nr:conserved hypothetical protein [uncultured Desulfobacteraceae bacterium]
MTTSMLMKNDNSQFLIDQFKEKMPEEIIESYESREEEQRTGRADYSIGENYDFIERKKAPVFFLESKSPGERAISLQKWQGIVEDAGENFFTAKLINLTEKGHDEWAEISYDEITEEDIGLIQPGAFFYWSIGYNHSVTGQRRRFSDIRFRRIPVWGEEEINLSKKQAKEITDLIDWK